MRTIILSLLFAAVSSGVQIAYDNTLTPDPGLAVTPFGPNTVEPISGLVIDLLGDQIQLDPSPTGWLNGYQATTSIYNLGDEFQGVLRLYLYNVSGATLGSLIGTFDSLALTLPTSGLTGTLVTWDLANVPLSMDMVWLVGVQTDNSPLGNLPLLGLENYVMPQGVGSSSDANHWWQLNTQPTVLVSSGFGNDSFYFQVTTVPEPGTWLLTSSVLLALAGLRRARVAGSGPLYPSGTLVSVASAAGGHDFTGWGLIQPGTVTPTGGTTTKTANSTSEVFAEFRLRGLQDSATFTPGTLRLDRTTGRYEQILAYANDGGLPAGQYRLVVQGLSPQANLAGNSLNCTIQFYGVSERAPWFVIDLPAGNSPNTVTLHFTTTDVTKPITYAPALFHLNL